MAPNTAFVLCSAERRSDDDRAPAARRAPEQDACADGQGTALFAVIGYAFNVSALYVVKSFFPMAMHTALMFLLLAAGILFARPDRGLMKILSADSATGAIATGCCR